MTLLTKPILYGVAASLLASLAWGGAQCSQKNAALSERDKARAELSEFRAKAAEDIARFEVMARSMEQRHAADMERIGNEYQERLTNAGDEAYKRAIADVRAGKLRNVWSCPTRPAVPSAGGSAEGSDEGAADRAEAIARVLRIGAEADQQLAACQAVVRADRAMKVTE